MLSKKSDVGGLMEARVIGGSGCYDACDCGSSGDLD